MSWLVKPRRREYAGGEHVISGVKCVVKVHDGYVIIEAMARNQRDLKILRRILDRCLSNALNGTSYED